MARGVDKPSDIETRISVHPRLLGKSVHPNGPVAQLPYHRRKLSTLPRVQIPPLHNAIGQPNSPHANLGPSAGLHPSNLPGSPSRGSRAVPSNMTSHSPTTGTEERPLHSARIAGGRSGGDQRDGSGESPPRTAADRKAECNRRHQRNDDQAYPLIGRRAFRPFSAGRGMRLTLASQTINKGRFVGFFQRRLPASDHRICLHSFGASLVRPWNSPVVSRISQREHNIVANAEVGLLTSFRASMRRCEHRGWQTEIRKMRQRNSVIAQHVAGNKLSPLLRSSRERRMPI